MDPRSIIRKSAADLRLAPNLSEDDGQRRLFSSAGALRDMAIEPIATRSNLGRR